jgi:hypothetical protein
MAKRRDGRKKIDGIELARPHCEREYVRKYLTWSPVTKFCDVANQLAGIVNDARRRVKDDRKC